jgi:hypothetical protein
MLTTSINAMLTVSKYLNGMLTVSQHLMQWQLYPQPLMQCWLQYFQCHACGIQSH